ncbi:unnamed protein product [Rotaria sordida]|uniref:Uncharacterized protein n=1 Tax=Rotaria sordida TaxID=392033 RepID=A0A820D5U2_9BILA|nr:unnamed protein product [Rotaria sordida]
MWEKDGLHPTNSCWLATDNAATFTGIHEGVIAKLKRHLSAEWLASTPCVAHSFALVGGEASYLQKSIRIWSSISGCIKPIVDNVYPGSQALLTCLQQIMLDTNSSNTERENAKRLLNSILEDEFLFLLHMHHDLHEIVL